MRLTLTTFWIDDHAGGQVERRGSSEMDTSWSSVEEYQRIRLAVHRGHPCETAERIPGGVRFTETHDRFGYGLRSMTEITLSHATLAS